MPIGISGNVFQSAMLLDGSHRIALPPATSTWPASTFSTTRALFSARHPSDGDVLPAI
ncbi:hypothetical protein [Variovorax sp. IB41]|uniref:hypothetical protein n=1 Tax=Variovorax sp. IB41 TaxID=2779370 RepID=UPI0018E75EE9|nr:hypothetical protein [Variovorax sp. IB41]